MISNIAQYEIKQLLGKGGMGHVYLAQDTILDRKVALKVIKEDLLDNQNSKIRFRQEAKTLAQLNHQGIAGIYNILEHDKQVIMVMEYVKGQTLEDLISQRSFLSPVEATRIVMEVLSALQHAHKKGIIHRDIKSSNIMLDQDNRSKLMDFGIAITKEGKRHTKEGSVVGTVEYIAPDILIGDNPSPTSDIYALGILLYELIYGRTPFNSPEEYSIIQKHLNNNAEFPEHPEFYIPQSLIKVIKKSLAKNPKQRYQSSEDFSSDLSKVNFEKKKTTKIRSKITRLNIGSIDALSKKTPELIFSISLLLLITTFLFSNLNPLQSSPSSDGKTDPISAEIVEPKKDTTAKASVRNKTNTPPEKDVYNAHRIELINLIKQGTRLFEKEAFIDGHPNLLSICKRIIYLDNDNEQAHQWIRDMIAYYQSLAITSYNQQHFSKANDFCRLILKIDKENNWATAQLNRIEEYHNKKSRNKEVAQAAPQVPKKERKSIVRTEKKPDNSIKDIVKEENVSETKVRKEPKTKKKEKKTKVKDIVTAFIPKKHKLRVSLKHTLSSDKPLQKNQPIQMYVTDNVYHQGKIIFNKNAKVKAKITDFKNTIDNRKGVVGFSIYAVQCSDGSWIDLKNGKIRKPGKKDQTIIFTTQMQFEVETASSKNISY